MVYSALLILLPFIPSKPTCFKNQEQQYLHYCHLQSDSLYTVLHKPALQAVMRIRSFEKKKLFREGRKKLLTSFSADAIEYCSDRLQVGESMKQTIGQGGCHVCVISCDASWAIKTTRLRQHGVVSVEYITRCQNNANLRPNKSPRASTTSQNKALK